ncbi:putative MCP methyltransferase, CheR-type [Treponema primitia ZAS-2]|uniref:Putative MCP methyltransferase, CheR-type n=1 Tax=Treponema primitia (strain ATCC BAA-887 / DSM 12427 / ZAS-2) TaxID=545694 RepID=F5YNN6_TREPZ|nr:CheR family methyltransferase [Treponema primitia]AEF84657.1 putative MCP methyltransferase, CheR-type [Treponema primitia ZAS-2]
MSDKTPLTRQFPDPVPVDPVLDKLSRWVENALGIKAGEDALQKLREYMEKQFNPNIFQFPGAFEWSLSSREERFKIARFLTINETYFFREEPHFYLLLKELLPRFARLNRPLRVCSAACSAGCEAYSLAMLMDHYSRTTAFLDFKIEAFDISQDMIEVAKQGRYTSNTFRDDGNHWKYILDEYLTEKDGEYMVNNKLKEKIHFFPHNIMDGLDQASFDLILFRNALIYFSAESRVKLLDSLTKSLTEGGVLLFGIAETPSVSHPLLRNKNAQGAFYFQKDSTPPSEEDRRNSDRQASDRRDQDRRSTDRRVLNMKASELNFPDRRVQDRRAQERRTLDRRFPDIRSEQAAGTAAPKPQPPPNSEAPGKAGLTVNMKTISALIEQGESLQAAERLLMVLKEPAAGPADLPASGRAAVTEEETIAAVISLLSLEDFAGANLVLSLMEKKPKSAFTKFLRGEYNYHLNKVKEAEAGYKEASSLNSAFWPAFYRMSLLAAGGNRTRYEYKIKKALESIDMGKDMYYECLIGGFSPDYYRRILEKRLSAEV